MKGRLLYALLGAAVPAAVSGAASVATVSWLAPDAQRAVEKRLIAPGRWLAERVEESPALRRAQEAAEERLEGPKSRLEKLAEGASETLGKTGAAKAARKRLRRLPHFYNAGLWGTVGFFLCLLTSLVAGAASVKDAVSLGVKATVTIVAMQAALVLGGLLAVSRAMGE